MEVSDGGKTDSIAVTISLTDVTEAPAAPAAPTFGRTTATSLTVNWLEPANTGPAITDYDVRYREGTSGGWTPHAHTGTERTATIAGLTEGRSYQVQVRARNAEGASGWSASGAATPAPDTRAPALASAAIAGTALTLTYDEALDTGSVPVRTAFIVQWGNFNRTVSRVAVSGRTVVLTMARAAGTADTVTVSYLPSLTTTPVRDLAGNAAASLSNRAVANATAGLVLSATSLTLAEGGSGSYTVRLAARPSASVTVAITSDNAEVTVDDTDAVASGVQNALSFTTSNWNRAQTVTVRAAEDADASNDSATLTHAISGASEYAGLADRTLMVTVNDDEKTNAAPAFPSDTATRSLAENTAAGTDIGAALAATDAEGDTLTYTLGGTDAASFDLVEGTGQLRTKSGVTYDFEAKSRYTVTVTADDGNGGSDTVTVTITLTDANEPPVFDTTGLTTDASGAVLFTVAENTAAVGTVTAADPDSADSVTYGIRHELRHWSTSTKACSASPTQAAISPSTAAPDFEARRAARRTTRTCTAFQSSLRRCWRHRAGEGTRNSARQGHRDRRGAAREAGGADLRHGDREQPCGELAGAGEPGGGDYGLRRAVPRGGGERLDGARPRWRGPHGDADGADGERHLRGAGAGEERRGRQPWSDAGEATTTANTAPVFARASYAFDLAENDDGSTTAIALGSVSATDADAGHTVRYSIAAGDDSGHFAISTAGALTYVGPGANHEATPSIVLTVRADDGHNASADVTVTVTVTDVAGEAPEAPAAPEVTATADSATGIDVRWTAPDNAGPAIGDYDVEYRRTGTTGWTSHAHVGAATATAIAGLREDTEYQVRVRATNAEGTGGWSAIGTGSTRAVNAPGRPLARPVFGDKTSTTIVVRWLEPANPGSAISDYDVRYRETGTTAWTDAGHVRHGADRHPHRADGGPELRSAGARDQRRGHRRLVALGHGHRHRQQRAGVRCQASYSFTLAENADGSTTGYV